MKKEQYADRESVLAFAKTEYQTVPEYLFRHSPHTAVLRHAANGKWYAIIMPVPRERLGVSGEGITDVMNVKCDPNMVGSFCMQEGFLPAYHMNKGSWISVLLDGTVPADQVFALLRMSYTLISAKAGRAPRTVPRAWLIPANPKYEDISASFQQKNELYWKQSAAFIPGDTVYIYEGKPIGAVTFACEVTAVNIPYHYNQDGLHMDTVVNLQLLKWYDRSEFPLERLRDFGVASVRGPRGIPEDLLAALQSSGRQCLHPIRFAP